MSDMIKAVDVPEAVSVDWFTEILERLDTIQESINTLSDQQEDIIAKLDDISFTGSGFQEGYTIVDPLT